MITSNQLWPTSITCGKWWQQWPWIAPWFLPWFSLPPSSLAMATSEATQVSCPRQRGTSTPSLRASPTLTARGWEGRSPTSSASSPCASHGPTRTCRAARWVEHNSPLLLSIHKNRHLLNAKAISVKMIYKITQATCTKSSQCDSGQCFRYFTFYLFVCLFASLRQQDPTNYKDTKADQLVNGKC